MYYLTNAYEKTRSKLSYDDWNTRPVLTTVSSTGFPISKIPFPAVTFCSHGKVPRFLFASLFRQLFEFTKINVEKDFGKNLTLYEIAAFHESKLAYSVGIIFIFLIKINDVDFKLSFNFFLKIRRSRTISPIWP